MSAHEVVSLSAAVLLTAALVDLAISDRLGLLYDLAFVTICVGAALAVRPDDFFAVGTLPPLAMAGVVVLLGLAQPAAIAEPQDGLVQATVSGLSGHGIALLVGYAACLGVLGVRRRVSSLS
ncbi:hypothetical protein FXB39_09585 [Nocardioides sp. BGMRC 2183]|nr:hypothetical protein FXB39_09585 [Nocardioides sp. BGMRC 2183]